MITYAPTSLRAVHRYVGLGAALAMLGSPGGGSGTLLAQEPITGTLVVTDKGGNTASIIDIGSRQNLATLPTGSGPHEVAVSHDGRWAVATNYGTRISGNSLTEIDKVGRSVTHTIDLREYERPHGAFFLPGDSIVAVTSEATRSVVLVRLADGEIVATIPTDQDVSHMITTMTGDGLAYTSNLRSGTITELNISERRRLRILDVAPQPEGIQVTPDGGEVWVASNTRGTVSVVNAASGEIEAVFENFSFPYRIAFTPDGRLAVVPDLRKDEIRVFDTATRTEVGKIEVAGAGPMGLIIPHNRTAFVSLRNHDTVAMIDLISLSVVAELPTGFRPDGVGYSELTLVR